MFWNSADHKTAEIVSKLENDMLGMQVISVQEWALPLYDFEVKFEITQPQELNLIEEFILKMALANIPGVENEKDYARMLGLDRIFIENYTKGLVKKDALAAAELPVIKITEIGKTAYKKGIIGGRPRTEKLAFYFEPLFGIFYPSSAILKKGQEQMRYFAHIEKKESFPVKIGELQDSEVKLTEKKILYYIKNATHLVTINCLEQKLVHNFDAEMISQDKFGEYKDLLIEKREEMLKVDMGYISSSISKDLVQKLGRESGARCVREELGEQTGKISRPSFLGMDYKSAYFTEILVYDEGDKSYHYRLLDLQRDEFLAEAENFLNANCIPSEKGPYTVTPILSEKYVTTVKKSLAAKKQEPAKPSIGISILRDEEIAPQFQSLISNADKSIMIKSPWINAQAVDSGMRDLFQKAVDKGCTIYIGWGIAKAIAQEDKKPPDWLLDKLYRIKNKHTGIPALSVIWLGNSHQKEVLIDEKIHLLGSFNWLSYRGDFEVRGESVVCINDKQSIPDTMIRLGKPFFDKLKESTILNIQREDWVRNVNAIVSLRDFTGEVDKELSLMLARAIENDKHQMIIDFVNVLAINDSYQVLFRKGLYHLLKTGACIDAIRTVLSYMKLRRQEELRKIIKEFQKELMKCNLINSKGKFSDSVGTLAMPKFNFIKRKQGQSRNTRKGA